MVVALVRIVMLVPSWLIISKDANKVQAAGPTRERVETPPLVDEVVEEDNGVRNENIHMKKKTPQPTQDMIQ